MERVAMERCVARHQGSLNSEQRERPAASPPPKPRPSTKAGFQKKDAMLLIVGIGCRTYIGCVTSEKRKLFTACPLGQDLHLQDEQLRHDQRWIR